MGMLTQSNMVGLSQRSQVLAAAIGISEVVNDQGRLATIQSVNERDDVWCINKNFCEILVQISQKFLRYTNFS